MGLTLSGYCWLSVIHPTRLLASFRYLAREQERARIACATVCRAVTRFAGAMDYWARHSRLTTRTAAASSLVHETIVHEIVMTYSLSLSTAVVQAAHALVMAI